MRHQWIMGALSAEAEVLNHQALQHGPLAGRVPNIRHPNIQRAEPTRLCKRCHSPRLGSLDDRLVDLESRLYFSNWTLPRAAFLRVSVVSGPRHKSKSTSGPGEEQTRLPHQSPRNKMSCQCQSIGLLLYQNSAGWCQQAPLVTQRREWCQCDMSDSDMRTVVQASIATSWYCVPTRS